MVENQERLENLFYVVEYIQRWFHTNIIVIESGPKPTPMIMEMEDVQCLFHECTDGVFHRTYLLNRGIKFSRTPFVSLYDTDVFFEPRAYMESLKMLQDGYSLVYPYSGKFVDVSRAVVKNGDIDEFKSFAVNSVGGACFLNRKDYWDAGLENENFISWGSEDTERLYRMVTLGYKVGRADGTCWHIVHPRGKNSGPENPYTKRNADEYASIKEMDKATLKEYIETWEWAKQLTR